MILSRKDGRLLWTPSVRTGGITCGAVRPTHGVSGDLSSQPQVWLTCRFWAVQLYMTCVCTIYVGQYGVQSQVCQDGDIYVLADWP